MYIGNDLQIAHPSYKIIDDISSGFNGSTTSFALQVSGATPVPFPISTQQVMISVNGVVQEPDPSGSAGFKLLGSNIVFSSAPANGHAFFGVINAGADYVTAGSEFPDGSATAPSFTFQDDQDTGWYRSASGAVNFSSNGVNKVAFDGNGITVSGSCTATSFSGPATQVTVADESSDTTCFPLFATAATGNMAPKSGTNLTFNSSSGALTATSFVGALTGNVTGNASGSSGSCTGNSATATAATTVTVADESSDTTCFPLFATAATGDLGAKSGSNLTFNSSSGALTATSFVGALTGNASGSAATVTGAAQSAITSVGTLTSLTVSGNVTVDTNTLHVDATNNRVGIGTTSPSTYLHIVGNSAQVKTEEAGGGICGMFSGGSTGNIGTISNHDLLIRTNNTERMRLSTSGYLGLNTNSPSRMLHLKAANENSSIRLENTADTPDNIWEILPSISGVSNTGFTIRDVTDSANRFVINGIGSVGIGTNSPSQLLHVAGTIINTTNVNSTGDQGITVASGHRLGFDQSGTRSWNIKAQNGNLELGSGDGNGSFKVDTTGGVSDQKGNLRSIPVNSRSSAYVAVANDAGKAISISSGGVTINASVFSAGDALTIINNSGSDQTITSGSGGMTIHNTADAATGNRTLAGRGMATIYFLSNGTAYISGAGLS